MIRRNPATAPNPGPSSSTDLAAHEVPSAGTAPTVPAAPSRPAHRADAPQIPRAFRRPASGGALLLTTALLLTGCSVPGMPGASGAPDSMVRTVTTDGPDQAQDTQDAGNSARGAEDATDDAAGEAPADDPTEEAATDDGGAAETSDAGAAGTSDAAEPAEPEWTAVESDLDTGSASHTLSAASRNLVIDYWTDADVSLLTPESTPIIRVTARMDGEDDGAAVTVTRFNAQVQSLGTELANDTGSFAIAPPYAYTTAVALPANPTAHSTELLVTFDLLTETAPGSGVFTRQTILDTVSLGYAQPPASNEDPAGEQEVTGSR